MDNNHISYYLLDWGIDLLLRHIEKSYINKIWILPNDEH